MTASSAVQRPHVVNLCALSISAMAWVAPLPTFILAYAVIGPFHYRTEIAWLRKKDFYFGDGVVLPRFYLIISCVLCAVACLDLYFRRGWAAYAVGALIVLSLGALVKNVPVLLVRWGCWLQPNISCMGMGCFWRRLCRQWCMFTALRCCFWFRVRWREATDGAGLGESGAVAGDSAGAGSVERRNGRRDAKCLLDGFGDVAGLLGLGMHFDAHRALEPNAIAVFRFLAFIYLHHYLN